VHAPGTAGVATRLPAARATVNRVGRSVDGLGRGWPSSASYLGAARRKYLPDAYKVIWVSLNERRRRLMVMVVAVVAVNVENAK